MGRERDGEAVPRCGTGLRGGPKLATWAIVAWQAGPKQLAAWGAGVVIAPGTVVAGSAVVAVEA